MSPTGFGKTGNFAERTLSEFIKLREEDEDHGFVHNKQNNLIYIADGEAIALLTRNQIAPIGRFAVEHPEAFNALGLHL
jgi:hypothetical protein